MNTHNPEWTCPKCKMVFALCICGPGGDGDEDETRDDRDTGEDIPAHGECPGYICPRPGPLDRPVHIQ